MKPGKLFVSVIGPDGDVSKMVQCQSARQCQKVIDREAEDAEPYTIFSVTGSRNGRMVPVDRWGMSARGELRRAPYRHNAFGLDPEWESWAKRLRKGSVVEFGGHRAKLLTAPTPRGSPPDEQTAKLKIAGQKAFVMHVGRLGPWSP